MACVQCTALRSAEHQRVTSLSAKCFFQLRQLRRIRRSLDNDSIATLVHAFVVCSRVDYCVGLLAAGAPKKTTDKLQRVLNSCTSGIEPQQQVRPMFS